MSAPVNYAKLFGFDSVAAAAIFAALWAPLCFWFFVLLFRHRSYVVFVLALFCQIRLVAFIIRAILAGSESAGESLGLFIADEVFFSTGFFGLLYGSYGLVMSRLALCHNQPFDNALFRLMRNHLLFHLTLSSGVVLGIVGIIEISNNPSSTLGSIFRKVSIIIFVALTVLQASQTVILAIAERRDDPEERMKHIGISFGARHGAIIFMCIAVLLLIRELFTAATIGSMTEQNNEHLWYSLVALPELLCLILYAIPGLIPPKYAEAPQYGP
ncbi:hypothetical protein BT96DRAFT_811717 [Gymnopus androsaceus JB14]|uniref:RTA1-domain-containing protein n=1 Tax=Gymnopus androsaceus JB14 TaxID=1447944 RepID=A0A6A4I533_9AGAR|nr:hypothetical protein BT96DRAFT_811717 [Gymnopus androsaceus JB14]